MEIYYIKHISLPSFLAFMICDFCSSLPFCYKKEINLSFSFTSEKELVESYRSPCVKLILSDYQFATIKHIILPITLRYLQFSACLKGSPSHSTGKVRGLLGHAKRKACLSLYCNQLLETGGR